MNLRVLSIDVYVKLRVLLSDCRWIILLGMAEYLVAPLIIKRRALGLSPTRAAQLARLHPDTAIRIEAGRTCHPASVKKYAEFLGVPMEQIVAIPDL